MAHDPAHLEPEITTFLTERHLASLTTMRADNTPHVVAVGFTWDSDESLVRVITWAGSRKARNVAVTNSALPNQSIAVDIKCGCRSSS